MERFSTNPDICTVEYSCTTISGPDGFSDLCSGGAFNAETREFSFTTDDRVAYPPGVYEIEVTGFVDGEQEDTTATEIITVTIVDPCVTTPLTLSPNPPVSNVEYTLRDPQ